MSYASEQPTPDDIRSLSGPAVLDFGTNWCGICQRARPLIEDALEDAAVDHIKVEDGKGRTLGRMFRVKLWPTLIFLRDGVEVGRVVRPTSSAQVSEALVQLVSGDGDAD